MRVGREGEGATACYPVLLQLFLVDVESQVKASLLSYCSYVQVGEDSQQHLPGCCVSASPSPSGSP